MPKQKMSYEAGRTLAEKIARRLAGACDRLEIAGSIRRGCGVVSDIELVAIPTMTAAEQGDLFDNPQVSKLDKLCQEIVDEGKMRRIKGGQKYQQFEVLVGPCPNLDLFIATGGNWGLIYCLRTGPWEFSRAAVTPVAKGGLLGNDCRVRDGRLWKRLTVEPGQQPPDYARRIDADWFRPAATPTEAVFMAHLTCGWIPPNKRRAS